MDNSYMLNENGLADNGHSVARQNYHPSIPSLRGSLPWLDIRVFYVRVFKCQLDGNSTPKVLTLNCVPPDPDTLLEVNGVRASSPSHGVSTLLKRDRVDRKSEEVTFVSTDSTKMSGSVKFEVLDKNVVLLSGVIELCTSNGSAKELSSHNSNGQNWSMNCESEIIPGTSFFKGKNFKASSTIEVYIAGSFLSTPIVLTKTLHLGSQKKHTMGTLPAIPEDEASKRGNEAPSLALTSQAQDNMIDNNSLYTRTEYMDEEDGEVTWFNAGVRVGVGIGLSVCLGIGIGIGIGVGVLVKSYQGIANNFRRRLL